MLRSILASLRRRLPTQADPGIHDLVAIYRTAARNEPDPARRAVIEQNIADLLRISADYGEVATLPLARIESDLGGQMAEMLDIVRDMSGQMMSMSHEVVDLHRDGGEMLNLQRQTQKDVGDVAVGQERIAGRLTKLEEYTKSSLLEVNTHLEALRDKTRTTRDDVTQLKQDMIAVQAALAKLDKDVLGDKLDRPTRIRLTEKLEGIPGDTAARLTRLEEQMQLLLDRLEEKM